MPQKLKNALWEKSETKILTEISKNQNLKETLTELTFFALHEKPETKNKLAIVLINSVRDLLNLEITEQLKLETLLFAGKIFSQIQAEEMNKEMISFENQFPLSIFIGDFEHSLRIGETKKAFEFLVQTLSVTDSKNYLLEILLNVATSNFEDDCKSVRFVNSCCRALGLIGIENINFVFYPSVFELCKNKIGYVELPEHVKPEVDFADFFAKSLVSKGENALNPTNVLHLNYIFTNLKVKPLQPKRNVSAQLKIMFSDFKEASFTQKNDFEQSLLSFLKKNETYSQSTVYEFCSLVSSEVISKKFL
ncbi:hypothetical protein IT568_11950 [bacterium]|nr:hypothetical protein [bacterium]